VKNNRIMLPVLASLFVLGFLVALGAAGSIASADSAGGGTTTSASTTDPVTMTDPGTSTGSGTMTDPGTTTASGTTTAAPGATTGATTTDSSANGGGSQTTANNAGATTAGASVDPPVGQTTTQGSPAATTPTAPCDTTQLTCGNNASTELAVVSQTCSTSSANTILNINIQTLAGNPVNNVTIDPTTSCLNELSLTQIVEQYCIACTVIVVPPPAPTVYVPQYITQYVNSGSPAPSTTTVTTTVVQQAPPEKVVPYCLPRPVVEADGTISSLVYLDLSQPLTGGDAGAVPASYKAGVGMMCPGASSFGAPSRVPMFTLTVPASFLNEYLQLCVQPSTAGAKPVCHVVKVGSGSTIAVPVSANVRASVINKAKLAKVVPAKSKAQIAKASSSLLAAVGPAKSGSKQTTKHHTHVFSHVAAKTRKGVHP
jgi:hypothetical protein